MRRKSERTATKKMKASPEKKVEKVKRGRTRRRKQSASSENESPDESSPVREVEAVTDTTEKKPPQTPAKEDSPEEAQDQVWRVKTANRSGDTGEIQKLKICLTRPPSTPERADRSPRSKRKHTRATSSSDTPSVEAVEDRRKSKHRSKRSTRESKDESDKNDSQGDEADTKTDATSNNQEQTDDNIPDETPMSTTNEDTKCDDNEKKTESMESQEHRVESNAETHLQGKLSDADTTVVSPKSEIDENQSRLNDPQKDSPEHKRSASIEKSEVLELHVDEKNTEVNNLPSEKEGSKKNNIIEKADVAPSEEEVSKTEDTSNITEKTDGDQNKTNIATHETNTVESFENVENASSKKASNESNKNKEIVELKDKCQNNELDNSNSLQSTRHEVNDTSKNRELEHSDSTISTQEEAGQNGQTAPIVISRKRRWGSRPNKVTSQKSITISTDVLKEIIPDVKPTEFDEVIEERKHKREVTEKLERPVLPKIIIDNTEHVEQHKREREDKDKENFKNKESNLALNRRISIVKDNDSIIARPPSPPRNKQSCILYITNLVRPFTLPLLKNLLQRTGRIVEDGFWIDRIKSKCFVKYETEDQAVETRHALHGVKWPASNPKTLQVDFSTQEALDKAKDNEETDNAQVSTIPGTVEDWLREQDLKRDRGETERPWERKAVVREWDVGKNEKDKDKLRRDDRTLDKRRHRTPERSPEPAKKFKKKEEEAPAKLLDDLFRKTKTTPCIYWLPLSAETIAIKEEQRRKHMAEHERRLQELRRTHRRH